MHFFNHEGQDRVDRMLFRKIAAILELHWIYVFPKNCLANKIAEKGG